MDRHLQYNTSIAIKAGVFFVDTTNFEVTINTAPFIRRQRRVLALTLHDVTSVNREACKFLRKMVTIGAFPYTSCGTKSTNAARMFKRMTNNITQTGHFPHMTSQQNRFRVQKSPAN